MNPNRVLVLDVELQCWAGLPPDGYRNDIIQLGLIEVDVERLVTTRSANYYIRPAALLISPWCTALTGITEETILKKGRPIAEVIRTLKEFGPLKKVTLTWGNDRAAIERACHEAALVSPFNFVDLGWLYMTLVGAKKGVSVAAALHSFGLSFEGQAHDAHDDARNTSRVYCEIIRRQRAVEDFRKTLQVG